MRSFEPGGCAVVVGAAGGIGSALVPLLLSDSVFANVVALARNVQGPDGGTGKLRCAHIDITDEASIVAAVRLLSRPVRLLIVATGILHGVGLEPEKSYRALDPDALVRSFRINTVGPALVAKHMLPLLEPRGRSVFAVLSARVGSIGENKLGGWHAYRASKAALNMLIRNFAIETSRRSPETLCVGLHPGTVDTKLSQRFQRSVPADRLFTPAKSAAYLLEVIDHLSVGDSGQVLAWDGTTIPP